MQSRAFHVLLASLGFLLTLSSAQAEGMRCGSRLVSTGDTLYDVESRCGAPDDRQHRVEMRTERIWIAAPCPNPTQAGCGRMLERTVEVSIDEWTYDFGPQRLIQRLTFEQGKLYGVASGSYGTKQQ